MSPKQIILALLSALATALNGKAKADSELQQERQEIAERDRQIEALYAQIAENGEQLNEVEKEQVRQLLRAADAAVPHEEVPAPVIVVPVVPVPVVAEPLPEPFTPEPVVPVEIVREPVVPPVEEPPVPPEPIVPVEPPVVKEPEPVVETPVEGIKAE